jgi:hypothetical protein
MSKIEIRKVYKIASGRRSLRKRLDVIPADVFPWKRGRSSWS